MRRRDALLAVAMLVVAVGLILARAGSGGVRAREAPDAAASTAPAMGGDPFAAFVLDDAPIDWSRPPQKGIVAPVGYAGSATCTQCHADVAKKYASRPMANTGMHRITARTPTLDAWFDGKHLVTHAASGFSYRAMRDDGGYFVEERLDAPDGRPLHVRREPVTLSFTAGTSGTAFGFERGGRMIQVPVDWYPTSAAWGLDPGYVQNGRFSRPFGVGCLACHTDYPSHVAANEPIVRGPSSEGIGCERCHGPGAKHASTMNAGDVVNPSRLSLARQLEVCAQCHLEGTAEVQRLGAGHFGWAVGTLLSDHQVPWVEKTPSVDWFALVGASDRLVRSACFLRSQGKLSCTTCHDAHGGTPATAMRQACVGCHTSDGAQHCSLSEADRLARGDDCAGCHMTRDTPSDFRQRVPGVRLEAVDHFIRKRPPPARPLDAAPVSQRVTEIVPWMRLVKAEGDAAIDVKERAANEVLAQIASGLDQQTAPQLLALAAAPPAMPALYRAIGDAYARALDGSSSSPKDPERLRLVQRLHAARAMELRLAPDDVDALVRYAQASILAGGPVLRDAESALRRALVIVPDDANALVELGGLLFRTARAGEAIPLLERAAIVGTDALEAHVILAVLACQRGDARSAVRHFENARRDAPRDRWILEQLANLYTGMGNAEGRDEIAHALQIVPVDARPVELRRSTRWLSPLR